VRDSDFGGDVLREELTSLSEIDESGVDKTNPPQGFILMGKFIPKWASLTKKLFLGVGVSFRKGTSKAMVGTSSPKGKKKRLIPLPNRINDCDPASHKEREGPGSHIHSSPDKGIHFFHGEEGASKKTPGACEERGVSHRAGKKGTSPLRTASNLPSRGESGPQEPFVVGGGNYLSLTVKEGSSRL